MTPLDRRKLAEAVAERLGTAVGESLTVIGKSSFAIPPVVLRVDSGGVWWIRPIGIPPSEWSRGAGLAFTGRNWLPRTADAIAEAVRAAGGAA